MAGASADSRDHRCRTQNFLRGPQGMMCRRSLSSRGLDANLACKRSTTASKGKHPCTKGRERFASRHPWEQHCPRSPRTRYRIMKKTAPLFSLRLEDGSVQAAHTYPFVLALHPRQCCSQSRTCARPTHFAIARNLDTKIRLHFPSTTTS